MEFEYTNKLIHEKSPYLLQHAHNPVNWFPWGEDAFKKAKDENKPVFLSIGYSTCHWCHVMEKESFEDVEVAKIFNDNFVCIKVDREERPDIDSVYMSVCQMMTGSGGWPLTVVMNYEQKPFFSGTYYPKNNSYGRIGLTELLQRIIFLWKNDIKSIDRVMENIHSNLNIEAQSGTESNSPSKQLLLNAYKQYLSDYDSENGGFGAAPKFPSPHNLLFLVKYSALEKEEKAKSMVENTLIQMYRGGIFDHIGGGFSRYSTDKYFLVPHFEKMLYDNALLIYTYASALRQSTDNKTRELFTNVITQSVDYLLKELYSPLGGFYCAQDADSDGEEGKFYLFTPPEIEHITDKNSADEFCKQYDITAKGHLDGKSIPNLLKNPNYYEAMLQSVNIRGKLQQYRKQRTTLRRDDKILTSWNALAIAALAKVGSVLNSADYIGYAKKAYAFIEKNLADKERLFIRWKDGEAANLGQLDDYAFYVWALIELYDATLDIKYLIRATEIADTMYNLFYDKKAGGLFLYAEDSEQLISRPKEYYDGAIPSGNSVSGYVLMRLSQLLADKKWQDRSLQQFNILASQASAYPTAHGFALFAMTNLLYPSNELICTTPDDVMPNILLGLPNNAKINNLTILIKNPSNSALLRKIAPFTQNYPITDKTTYYYCHNGMCEKPIYNENELLSIIVQKQ